MNFRVDLDVFRGPLDLLLYLVRKHEVEVLEIPVSLVTEQFLAYLAVLEELDVNAVGDFVDVASTLIEIKSRILLPRTTEEDEFETMDQQEFVHRLLQYKMFRDVASILEERNRFWQQRYPRLSDDLPVRRKSLAEQPIHEVELWDLVSAFGRIVRDNAATEPSSIVYDDTPIHVYMTNIHTQVARQGQLAFGDLFTSDMHKSKQVGIFLAMLELVRHHYVRSEQNDLFGEIWVLPGIHFDRPLDLSVADDYDYSLSK